MKEYIAQTVEAIGDYPYAWDVVNEAVNDGPSQIYKDSPWSIVEDYICKAFKAARDAAPKGVKLFYNDYKHASMTGIYQRKSDNIFNMIKNMTERGKECPIDGVGFQDHIDINYDSENFKSISQNIQRYGDIGIEVHFTETDVRCKQSTSESKG